MLGRQVSLDRRSTQLDLAKGQQKWAQAKG